LNGFRFENVAAKRRPVGAQTENIVPIEARGGDSAPMLEKMAFGAQRLDSLFSGRVPL